MEYYKGVLFLTTNRPGQLDEAIKSRVHCALLYQTLNKEQTLQIFKLNIKRLEYIEMQRGKVQPDSSQPHLQADKTGILDFARRHCAQHEFDELGRWNGRQIRNAFILAAALARGDADSTGSRGRPSVVLTDRHFQNVANNITAFDKYMARARGALDSERARTRSDRPAPDDDSDSVPNRRSSRNPNLKRPSYSNLGATPQTPTSSRQYSLTPVSPTPPYYLQPSPPAPPPAQPPAQQPYAAGYAYPGHPYGGPVVPVPMWPPSTQPGVQGPPPTIHHQAPPTQQYHQGVQQQGSEGMGYQGSTPQPPQTPENHNAQTGPR